MKTTENRFFAVFSGIEMALVHSCGPKAVFNPFSIGNYSGNALNTFRIRPKTARNVRNIGK
jgi:hypothetical protein